MWFTPGASRNAAAGVRELRAEATTANSPAVRPVGSPHIGPAKCLPCSYPKRNQWVGLVQAPPAEPERQVQARIDLLVI